MRHLTKLSVVAIIAAFLTFISFGVDSYAQNGSQNGVHGAGFVDENGDGYNDNAPDHDGDGISNGQDPDYVPLNPDKGKRFGFIDEDGDGINDRMQDADGDGIPNCQDPDWVKPKDGTGNKFGQKAGQMGRKGFRGKENGQKLGFGNGTGNGSGVCDGTGPKSKVNKGGSGSGK